MSPQGNAEGSTGRSHSKLFRFSKKAAVLQLGSELGNPFWGFVCWFQSLVPLLGSPSDYSKLLTSSASQPGFCTFCGAIVQDISTWPHHSRFPFGVRFKCKQDDLYKMHQHRWSDLKRRPPRWGVGDFSQQTNRGVSENGQHPSIK